MGTGFVISIHLITIFFISFILSAISCIITFFVSNKYKRKRKILLALVIPFQSLYSFYLLIVLGLMIISSIKKVDIGLGDSFYVPIGNSCKISMIDTPENADLDCEGKSYFHDIIAIQVNESKVYGKTLDKRFFTLNLNDKSSERFSSESELKLNITKTELQSVGEFYSQQKWEMTKTLNFIVLILSLLLSTTGVFLLYRFIMYGWKLGFDKEELS